MSNEISKNDFAECKFWVVECPKCEDMIEIHDDVENYVNSEIDCGSCGTEFKITE